MAVSAVCLSGLFAQSVKVDRAPFKHRILAVEKLGIHRTIFPANRVLLFKIMRGIARPSIYPAASTNVNLCGLWELDPSGMVPMPIDPMG